MLKSLTHSFVIRPDLAVRMKETYELAPPTSQQLLELGSKPYEECEDWENEIWFWFVNDALPVVNRVWKSNKIRTTDVMTEVCDENDEWYIIFLIDRYKERWEEKLEQLIGSGSAKKKKKVKGQRIRESNVSLVSEDGRRRIKEIEAAVSNRRKKDTFKEWVDAVKEANKEEWDKEHPVKKQKKGLSQDHMTAIPTKL